MSKVIKYLCLFTFLGVMTNAFSQAAIRNPVKEAKGVLKANNEARKLQLIDALALIRDKKAADVIADIIDNEDQSFQVRNKAVKSIQTFDHKTAVKILKKPSSKIKDQTLLKSIMKAYFKLEDHDVLAKSLTSSTPTARGAAFLHLAREFDNGKSPAIDEKILKKIAYEKKEVVLFAIAKMLASGLKEEDGLSAENVEVITEALLSEKASVDTRGAALSSLALSGVHNKKMTSILKNNHMHQNWRVRLDVLSYFEKLGKTVSNVKFLVNWLNDENGRLKSDIADVLTRIIGCENHGLNVAAWKKEMKKIGAEGGEGIEAKSFGDSATYYGMKIATKRPIFILDITGSMATQNKMMAAKKELCRALRELDKDTRKDKKYMKQPADKKSYFNILLFAQTTTWWKEEMTVASDDNIEEACKFVMAANPIGGTFTDLALNTAFKFTKEAFAEEKKKAVKAMKKYGNKIDNIGVDTIFLVTDGYPSRTATGDMVQITSRAQIQVLANGFEKLCKSMYKEQRIKINCIGILMPGEVPPNPILEAISGSTKGNTVYVDPATGEPVNKPGQNNNPNPNNNQRRAK